MAPTDEELDNAIAWVAGQDVGPEWDRLVREVANRVRSDR